MAQAGLIPKGEFGADSGPRSDGDLAPQVAVQVNVAVSRFRAYQYRIGICHYGADELRDGRRAVARPIEAVP